MPYLRQEGDDTLGSTLGNLGASITQAFNPLKQIEAQNVMSEMQMRRWELQQKANIDEANRQAADTYSRSPLLPGETQAMHDAAAADLRAGRGNLSQNIEAIKAAGGYAANSAAAGLVDTDPELQGMGDADRANIKARVLSGQSLSQAKTEWQSERLKANEADATIRATTSARTAGASTAPGFGANADLTAEAASRGDVAEARKSIAAGQVASADPNTPAFSPASQNIVTQQAIAGLTPPAGQPPLLAQTPAYDAEALRRKAAEADLAPTAPTVVRPQQTIQFPAVAPGGESASVTVPARTPDTAASAATTTAVTTSEEQAKADVADVNTTIGEAASAANLDDKLDQLAELTKLYENMGTNTVDTALIKYIGDRWNVNYGTRAEVYKAMENLINDELPDARKAAGIQRLAAPEISATKLIIGSPNLPPSVLYNIIANEKGMAQLSIQKGALAQKAAAHQITMDQYRVQKAAINSRIHETIEALRKQYGATGTQKTPAPTPTGPTQTVRKVNGVWVDQNGNPVQ